VSALRTGGDLAVESLIALGAVDVVGLPGQHALGLFDALSRSPLRLLEARVENNAGFMADGLARARRDVVPLLLSTGPGALTALPALMESAISSIPVLAISSQIPVAGLGGARRGYMHELRDQSQAFQQVVKHSITVRTAGQIPSALQEAWQIAASAPQGPVLLEIPEDVLRAPLGAGIPHLTVLHAEPVALPPRDELVAHVVGLLESAANPVLLIGGGADRASAGAEVLAIAERLDAPIVSTFSGRNAVPAAHPLHAGSWLEDIATTEFLEAADVVLAIGGGLGDLSTNTFDFHPRGQVVQINADLGVFTSSTSDVMVHADARAALAAIADGLTVQSDPDRRASAVAAASALVDSVRARLDGEGLAVEQELLHTIRRVLPDSAPSFWDMTILGYWAWSAWDRREGDFVSAQGSGGLGHAFPAAIGASFAAPGPVLAVSGDGGAMYGIAEIVTAVQNEVNVTWLIVNSGGYGVLETYMNDSYGVASAVDLVTPDFEALATACGASAVTVDPAGLEAALAAAVGNRGVNIVVLTSSPRLFAGTRDLRTV
jgi:acetolactate synthase-1/2/3 large subunit